MITLYNDDAVKWARAYKGPLFHALLSDPPYHLTSITKRFGNKNSSPAKPGKDGAFGRLSKGFMGTTWDGGDIAFKTKTWLSFKKVLYPGAFGIAFSGSRSWHRMAMAIERAGFIIHPTIFLWVYSSGFPKATRVKGDRRFDGHRYGAQALKPAVEPILVFQKPYDDMPLSNITETGSGVLNIEAGRIGNAEIPINRWSDSAHPFGDGSGNEYETVHSKGRWPSNFILGSEETADRLDQQTGILKSGLIEEHHVINSDWGYGGGNRVSQNHATSYGDEGGSSRFFFSVSDRLEEIDPVYYCAKASVDEKGRGLPSGDFTINDGRKTPIDNPFQRGETIKKNPHPTVKPLDLCRHLAALLLPPREYSPRRLFVPFSGVASECIGAHLAGWDEITGVESDTENKYIEAAKQRIDYWTSIPIQLDLFQDKPHEL